MKHANTTPRILALVPYKVFPAVMGGQKGIALFYKYLAQKVSLNCFTTRKNEPDESYVIYTQLSNSATRYINPALFFTLKKLANQTNRTHILFEHPYFAWLILLCKLFLQQKIIVHSHNIESERFKSIGKWWWRILWVYEKIAYRLADYVWFKTEEDLQYAVLYFRVKEERCTVIPYGVETDTLPVAEELQRCRKQISSPYYWPDETTLILFNGTLNYAPNLRALDNIINHINPLLIQSGLQYKLLICGKGLSPEKEELKKYADANIVYCGFVDDIDIFFKGCDIFLNPLQDGGGIKTKLVEALGFGKTCVSSENGAIGVPKSVCGERLHIVADKDWPAYVQAIIHAAHTRVTNDNQSFYTHFSWQHIAQKAVQSLAE